MPVLQPAENWEKTGRYAIEELFKLEDRKGSPMVLAMTHEEAITHHVAREVRSYRDLPHDALPHPDEGARRGPPRAGVLRSREFTMKDAYSFDRDEEGLEESYRLQGEAYERIFDRCGLRWYRVESDVGMMGGSGAHEYMAPCPAGENEVALAPGYAANVEVASAEAQAVELPAGLDAPEEVSTPGKATIDEVSGLLQLPPGALLKALPVIVEGRGMAIVLIRGDHRLNEIKLRNALGAGFRQARAEEIEAELGPVGFIGPVGAGVPVYKDAAIAGDSYVTGANRADTHLRGVRPGRDFDFEELDARSVEVGDTIAGWGRDRDRARDRGRQHLQARNPLLGAIGGELPRRGGGRADDRDGQLRDRPGADRSGRDRAGRRRCRDRLAHRDRPLEVHLVSLAKAGEEEREAADHLYASFASDAGRRGPLRRSRRGARGEADRRGAARLPAAGRRRSPRPRRRRGRGQRAGERRRAPAARAGGSRAGAGAARPMAPERAPFGQGRVRRLFGLDRSGPPPRQTGKGEPLNPWTIPNFVGYARLGGDPALPLPRLRIGRRALRGGGDRLLADRRRRLRRWLPRQGHRPVQPSRRSDGPVHRPPHDPRRRGRLLALRAAAALGARRPRRPGSGDARARPVRPPPRGRARVNWPGRISVFPIMGGIFFALVLDGWVPEALLVLGVGLAILATVLYARTGLREVALARGAAGDAQSP